MGSERQNLLHLLLLVIIGIIGLIEEINGNLRHKSLNINSFFSSDKNEQERNPIEFYSTRYDAHRTRFIRKPNAEFAPKALADDSIPEPHLLDPKDVAVLYQLQTVTQSSVEHSSKNESGHPYLVEPSSRNIVTRAGQTASLTCIVKNLGDRQISWIRGRDLHVLSSGTTVFASDPRVEVTYMGSRWTLLIRYSQIQDSGLYTCQINTEEPVAIWLNLTVIEAKAVIEGPPTLYIQEGSTITITCNIKEELIIPGLVLWYHGDVLVPRDSKRIKTFTELTNTNITSSSLNITFASTTDSGNYSCWPASGKPDTVFVHVIQGDPPAAMQDGNSAFKLFSKCNLFYILILSIFSTSRWTT